MTATAENLPAEVPAKHSLSSSPGDHRIGLDASTARHFDDLAARVENCREVNQREIQKSRSDLTLIRSDIADLNDQLNQTNARLTFLTFSLFLIGIICLAVFCVKEFVA